MNLTVALLLFFFVVVFWDVDYVFVTWRFSICVNMPLALTVHFNRNVTLRPEGKVTERVALSHVHPAVFHV